MKVLRIVFGTFLLLCSLSPTSAHEKLRGGYLVYGPKIEMSKVIILLNTSIFSGKSIELKHNFTAHYRYNPAGGAHEDKPVFIFVTAKSKEGIQDWIKESGATNITVAGVAVSHY